MLIPQAILLLLFLANLAALPPLATDMGLPALHEITAAFHTDAGTVGLTLSLFMAGFAATPIIYGPLSDRYGRRPILLVGLTLFAIGGVAAALAPSIDILLLARFIEGAGAGAGTSMAFAVVRDNFAGEKARTQLSYMQMVMGFAPMIAPTLGAFLLLAGWRVIYGVLGLGGIALVLYVLFVFKESHTTRSRDGSVFAQVIAGYKILLGSRAGLGFALVYGLSFGVLFSYISGSPLVFMGHYGVSPRIYGGIFALCAAGILCGTFTNAQLARRGISGAGPIAGGLILYILTSAAMLLALALHEATLAILIIPLVISAYAFGLIGPNASHGALHALPQISGIAGAVLTSLQMTVGFISSAIVAACYDALGTYAMVVPMAGFGIVTTILYVGMVRPVAK
jgi:DHA1 family bicyclomycin/chloramphenicol resistance-like MFS transporter